MNEYRTKWDFRQRAATDHIYVAKQDTFGKSLWQLYCQARRKGELDTGYHYILRSDGTLEADRPTEAVAQWDFKDSETSLYVLAEAKDKLSSAQHLTLTQLQEQYPNATICEV